MRERQGLIFDIQRCSVHDGPGIRTLVFLKGCPLRCPWCCNPEGQETEPEIAFRRSLCIGCGVCRDACSSGAIRFIDARVELDRRKCTVCGECTKLCPSAALSIVGRWMTVEEVLGEVERDLVFYETSGGGVTVSGGEPFAQADFTGAFLEACKGRGMATAIETAGFASWHSIEPVIRHADLILYDIKKMDCLPHRQLTGVSNQPILENAGRIAGLGVPIVIRYPVIPGLNDTPEALDALFRFASTLPGLKHIELLPYHRLGESKYTMLGRDYALRGAKPMSRRSLESLVQGANKRGQEVRIVT
jgi:pyruvate formate lyase activating enzyme